MKRGFTLIELLVVIAIMGILGTASVGGYRAMQRGMEERGVIQNVETFMRMTFERAQIDRQPTAMFYWNETIRSTSLDENEIVVGRAVAVRRHGRLSRVSGSLLIDEFGDLDLAFATDEAGSVGSGDPGQNGDGGGDAGENTMYIYCLDNIGGGDVQLKRSIVYNRVSSDSFTEVYLNGMPNDNVGNGQMDVWGFKLAPKNNFTNWRVGSAYGFEFAEITLPHGYLFGSDFSRQVEDPIRGERTMVFNVSRSSGTESGVIGSSVSGSGGSTIEIYSLRPDGSGGLAAKSVGTAKLGK